MRGLAVVAVYSYADKDALHVRMADNGVRIGPPAPKDSYLDIDAILAAAKSSGADAIHPGYGFLAENAEFAEAVEKAGLVFVGPPAASIRAMGDKAASKKIARKAGVPVVPGYDGDDQSDAHLAKEASAIGFPVMIKASAGGGGRGMRRVAGARDFPDALASARREAESAFGDGRLLLEKALDGARHVEVQVLCDAHGHGVHLGERDCSVQRRNQKVIEEAPAPGLPEETRTAMGEAALTLARAIGYVNAGTVEFLLDRDGTFYFLEMNTRIQVEHPVTECITGRDLVALQLAIASGEKLPFAQRDVTFSGHAIEARLCAEDAGRDFAPQSGRIARFEAPEALRVDSGIATGAEVSPHYDSLLAKLVAHGATREEARRRLIAGLRETAMLGLHTNRDFLIAILESRDFAEARLDTAMLARVTYAGEPDLESAHASLAALILEGGGSWRSTGSARALIRLAQGESHRMITVESGAIAGLRIEQIDCAAGLARVADGGVRSRARFAVDGVHIHVDWQGRGARFEDTTYAPAPSKDASDGAVRAPMAGRVASVLATPGARVEKGTLLLTLEAMKMEHEIRAPCDGEALEITVALGDQVAARQLLIRIAPEGDPRN